MFKVDFIDGKAVKWRKTDEGVKAEKHPEYNPRFYIEGGDSKLRKYRPWISSLKQVKSTNYESWRPTLTKPEKKVLRVDTNVDEVMSVVNRLKKEVGRSAFRYYNVGFSPQFRYCLQEEVKPLPEKELNRINLQIPRRFLSKNDVSELRINGEKIGGTDLEALKRLKNTFERDNPDILLVNRGQVLKVLNQELNQKDFDFSLGRMDKFQELAGENTVSSYGKTVHSNARYNVPGRIVIDRSNSFLLGEATLEGLWDLVGRSYRPMQELAWGSIGRLLTSIEIKKAYLEDNTLTPWKNWNGESPKKASKMHKADRGGFIFNPEPSIHTDVYEADFASLFPNIMVKKNISPETVCCKCCENSEVPELGYSICEEQRGFISEVLEPLVEDRQEMKERLKHEELGEEEERYLQGSVDAIKWLLVSCFGYMGHSHASYGAIKCHQAIQAYDRDIMVETKEMFEQAGYSIGHGIIDSIWVQEKEDAENFQQVCERISDEIGILLEPEHKFEWCAFVPRSSTEARIGTLNRYFGKKQDGEFKTAGIEVEQDSECKYVQESQMEMIKALDERMKSEDVLEVLKKSIDRLESGKVSPEKLVITKKTSKSLEQYQVDNRTVSALKRYKRHGIEIKPGQSVSFIVRDDNAPSAGRVLLEFEAEKDCYDYDFYREKLFKAAESVLSPLGFERSDIRSEFSAERCVITDYT